MKNRETRREIPTTEIYFSATLEGHEDEHWFRTPSALKISKVMEAASTLTGVLSLLSQGRFNNVAQMASLVSQAGPEVLSVMGWLIGLAWHHPTRDLVASRDDCESGLEYGEAVYEELYDAGYSLQEVLVVVLAILDQVWDRNEVDKEAIEQAGFIKRLKASQPSSEQTSKSTGSEAGKEGDLESSPGKTKSD